MERGNIRNVSSTMKPFIVFVLKRDKIPYRVEPSGDGYKFYLKISSRRFTEVLEDALCEKQRRTTMSRTPVYSLRTMRNPEKRDRLMRLNGRKGFHILKQDREKYEQLYG